MIPMYKSLLEASLRILITSRDAEEILKVLPEELPPECSFTSISFKENTDKEFYKDALGSIEDVEHGWMFNDPLNISIGELLMLSVAAKATGVEEKLPNDFNPGWEANNFLLKESIQALYISFQATNAETREFTLEYLRNYLRELEQFHKELSEKENAQ